MSDTPAPDSALNYARALLGVYVRTTLWFLGFVSLLWILGFEAIHAHPTPFYALIAPLKAKELPWATPCAAVATALLTFLVRWAARRPISDYVNLVVQTRLSRRQLWSLVAFAALFPALIAMMRGGFNGISDAYARESYEYIGDIGKGGSIQGLFHDYARIHRYLSMHAKVHPPGPIAILWLLSNVAGREPLPLSIATILFGALAVVPMYKWAVDVLGERRGLIATLLYTLVPSIVIFTATSADITFMPFTMTTLYFFWRAIHWPLEGLTIYAPAWSYRLWRRLGRVTPRDAYALGAGIFYGILGLISFSLLSLGAFFAVVGLWRLRDRKYWWPVIRTAVIMAVAAVAVHYLVYLWSGYNSIEVFKLSRAQFATDQGNLDQMDPRWPAWMFRFVNPLSWFFYAGIPVSVLALRRLRPLRSKDFGLAAVVGLTMIAFDILYLARGEGERSAMYVMPFLTLPAAAMLDDICTAAKSWRPLAVTLAFLGAQSIAIETILYTYW